MLALSALTACGGGSRSSVSPQFLVPLETAASTSLPGPFDERSMHAVRGSLPIGANALRAFPHINPTTDSTNLQARSPQNTGDNDAGGQAGYIIAPGAGSGDGGIYVAMTAYDDTWVTTPTDGSYNTVNAPTTHGPNGNCIEVVTNYYNGFGTPGTTVDQIQFYDFCANNGQGAFVGAIPMTADFVRDYVRTYQDSVRSLPRYISAVMYSTADKRWHAYLYNASLMQYVDFYDSAAGASTTELNAEGWSIFETHYHGGDCTALPDASEESIQVHSSSGWHLLSGALASWYIYGTCFSAPLSDPYYSAAYSTSPNVTWTVSSPVSPALSDYARAILANTPTAYYRLGDSGTIASDSSGSGLIGSYGANVRRNAPSLLATEALNGAALFPGGTSTPASFISIPPSHLLQPSGSVSIEAWVRESKPNPGTTNDLVAYGSRLSGLSYTIQILANNTVGAFVTTSHGYGLVTSKTVLSPNRAYLLDATYDGANLALFINGASEASSPTTGSLVYAAPGAANGLSIGSAANSTRPVFAGALDEVAVFRTALTAAQIASHWTAGSGVAVAPPTPEYATIVTADTPLVFYRLSDTARVAVDAGLNHINATYGAAVTANVAGLLSTDVTNNAAQFPGGASSTSASISMPRNTKLEPSHLVSLETWIKTPANPSGTIDLVSYGPQPVGFPYTLQLSTKGTIAMFVTTTSGYGFVQGTTALSSGTPHLIDGTYDGATLRIYIDGVLDASAQVSGSLNYSKQSTPYGLSLGTAFGSARSAFDGVLDDVAVYATSLSASRVAAHWTAGSGRASAP